MQLPPQYPRTWPRLTGYGGVTGRLRTFGRCRSTALPGLGRHPDRVDERRECRGYLAPTWV